MNGMLKILSGFLLIGCIYGYFILQSSPESGPDKYVSIAAMGFGAFVFGVLSIEGLSQTEVSGKKWKQWKMGLLIIAALGFAAYYYFVGLKP